MSVVDMRRAVLAAGFREIAVAGEVAERMERLPRHHLDPFDRLLIAQAQLSGAAVLTPDPAFRRYDVEVIW